MKWLCPLSRHSTAAEPDRAVTNTARGGTTRVERERTEHERTVPRNPVDVHSADPEAGPQLARPA